MKFLFPEKYYEMEDSEVGGGTKHLVVKAGNPGLATNVGNRPDGSYATNDLFVAHPSKPGYWYIVGRADDTLVMYVSLLRKHQNMPWSFVITLNRLGLTEKRQILFQWNLQSGTTIRLFLNVRSLAMVELLLLSLCN